MSRRVQSLLERRGLGSDSDSQQADPLSQDDPGIAALLANSVCRRIAVGSNAGNGVVRLGDQIDGDFMGTNADGPTATPPAYSDYPPEGWAQSALHFAFHPTVDVHGERIGFHRSLEHWPWRDKNRPKEPESTLQQTAAASGLLG